MIAARQQGLDIVVNVGTFAAKLVQHGGVTWIENDVSRPLARLVTEAAIVQHFFKAQSKAELRGTHHGAGFCCAVAKHRYQGHVVVSIPVLSYQESRISELDTDEAESADGQN